MEYSISISWQYRAVQLQDSHFFRSKKKIIETFKTIVKSFSSCTDWLNFIGIFVVMVDVSVVLTFYQVPNSHLDILTAQYFQSKLFEVNCIESPDTRWTEHFWLHCKFTSSSFGICCLGSNRTKSIFTEEPQEMAKNSAKLYTMRSK